MHLLLIDGGIDMSFLMEDGQMRLIVL
jgi:hypothetical protein